jgi:stress-induced morphogen
LDKRFAAEKIQAAIDNGKLQVVENEKTNVELVRLGREEIKNEMDKIKKQKEANAKFEADKTADQQKSIKKREDLAKDEIDLEKKKAEKIKEIDDNRKKEEEEKRKELREIEIQEAEYTAQIVSTIFNGFMDIRQQRLQNEMTLMQRRYDEEIRLADGNVQKITEIEEKRKQAEREFRIQQFKANQAQAVSNVIFALGPQIIANPKLAPFIIGLAAAQIAVIVAQPVPEFYKGVENFEGGLAKVGERGSELIETKNGTFLSPDKPTLTYLPKGTNVITATKTKERMQMLNSSYRNGQDRFQAVDVTPIAEQISRIPISINNLDERGFTEYVRKGNRTTQILNKRKGL